MFSNYAESGLKPVVCFNLKLILLFEILYNLHSTFENICETHLSQKKLQAGAETNSSWFRSNESTFINRFAFIQSNVIFYVPTIKGPYQFIFSTFRFLTSEIQKSLLRISDWKLHRENGVCSFFKNTIKHQYLGDTKDRINIFWIILSIRTLFLCSFYSIHEQILFMNQ